MRVAVFLCVLGLCGYSFSMTPSDEWARWHALADVSTIILPRPDHVMVPLDHFTRHPQSFWHSVMELCAQAGHKCHLDWLVEELNDAHARVDQCRAPYVCMGSDRMQEECQQQRVIECINRATRVEELKRKGQDPNRIVAARISTRFVSE